MIDSCWQPRGCVCHVCSKEDIISIASYRNTDQLVNVSVAYGQYPLARGHWGHTCGHIKLGLFFTAGREGVHCGDSQGVSVC